ncbi:MAG: DUF4919 domain-containing protein [Porphyromonadaceae bacterium]|nr:DUF4919 domain-containing protein [Porphyromonadaceae bacterium]
MRLLKLLAVCALSLSFSLPSMAEDNSRRTQRKVTRRIKKNRIPTNPKPSTLDYDVVRNQRKELDSMRLLNGGVKPIIAQEKIPGLELEPFVARFNRGDTTLRRETIKGLYFGHQSKMGEGSFLQQMELEVDKAIANKQFGKALKMAQRGLWRNPMHFALIKRACDLSHHEGHNRMEVYLWQIVQLFNVVESTGDGKRPETALQVMSQSDALLYEMLWLDTPREHVTDRTVVKQDDGKQLLRLEIKPIQSGGVATVRYYTMPIPI